MSCPISTKPHNPDVDNEIAQYKNRRAEAVEEEYVGTTKWRKEREMSFLEKPSQKTMDPNECDKTFFVIIHALIWSIKLFIVRYIIIFLIKT